MTYRRTDRTKQKGVTMVELLVALAIMAAIILIALPDYLNTILPEHRVRAAARDVMTDMRFADLWFLRLATWGQPSIWPGRTAALPLTH